ncbi:hypothetical protein [Silvimonas sp.]|uniref:hypothetical protein n=1 Tax=Silvimonas sp. TaxID=2650811 RepID=UPI00283F634E|nr:hypothetical protein [Silvimonas sp.]MDR3427809.1 hypothetical protein [Silvimonas sp.]
MDVVIRKNEVVFTGAFVAQNGSTTQPTSAEVVCTYLNRSGGTSTDVVALTYSSVTNTWSGTWDSSNAAPGVVDYTIYGYGSLIAALDGRFQIKANASNLTIA